MCKTDLNPMRYQLMAEVKLIYISSPGDKGLFSTAGIYMCIDGLTYIFIQNTYELGMCNLNKVNKVLDTYFIASMDDLVLCIP